MKTVMKWALCSREGFFTHIAPALSDRTKIIALATRDPFDAKILLFDTHKELKSVVNAVEAAMAVTGGDSPFVGFVGVRIPYTVETVLPEPPPEVPVV